MNMGISKTIDYTEQDLGIARWTKALGHPARIAILQFLLKKPGCMCGDIVNELPIAQATVSQHLKALKEAGLIQGEIDGVSVCYCIDEKAWKTMQKDLEQFLKQAVKTQGHCAC